MSLYKKIINGQVIVREGEYIIIIKDDMQTINPTHEMILEDGGEEYKVEIKDKEEKPIELVREMCLQKILEYDSSENVNIFYMHNNPIGLDKATRVGLKLRFEAEIGIGLTETTLWYNGTAFPLNLTNAIQMLYAIELYASECYDVTQRHISIVKSLETIEEIENYDYTTGYPEKLRF